MRIIKTDTGAKQFSIRSQLVTMFMIVILPLFAASIVLILNMRTTVRSAALETALNNSNSLKYRITDVLEAVESSVSEIASNQSIISFLKNNYTDREEYYSYYSESAQSAFRGLAPQIKQMYIYSEREDFVFGSRYVYADEDVVNSDWYRNAVAYDGVTYWGVVKNPADEAYYLSCIKAITDRNGTAGVVLALISDDWITKALTDESFSAVLSVGRGMVYYSDYPRIEKGEYINPSNEFFVTNTSMIYDHGFFDFRGYTVMNNFYHGGSFQIVMLLPSGYVNYAMNQLSIVYGGYCALMIFLSMLIIILFSDVFSQRIKLLSEKMHSVAAGNFNIDINDSGKDEISQLYTDLAHMISDMQQLINDNYQVRLQSEAFKVNQIEAEFKALASQINPHFLYNTLETIRMKAYVNNDKETAGLVKKLGKFMRRCLEFKDGEVTLRSELEFTSSYLELQGARFGDRVSYSIYSEVSKDYMILPLLIQPIVENAFVHGIEGNKRNGRIDVKVYYRGEYVIADVTDNGQGISEEKLRELEEKLEISDTSSGKSIGLTNVCKRIKMYHGEEYGMTIKSKEGEGTTIRLTLPRRPVSRLIQSAGEA